MSMTVLYKDGEEKAIFSHQLNDWFQKGWSLEKESKPKVKNELDKKTIR